MTDDGTNRCVPIPGNGGDCSLTNICLDMYTCEEKTKRCVSQHYRGFGEPCSNQTQCTSSLSCYGTCSNSNYPKCFDDAQCKYNEHCINSTCAVPFPDGAACKSYAECSSRSSCLNNVCVPFFSGVSGDKCGQNEDCDIFQDLLCIKWTCQNKNILTNTKCNSSDTCPMFLSACMCDGSPGPFIGRCSQLTDPTAVSIKTRNDYYQCLEDHKCPEVTAQIPGSCAFANCGNPLAKVYQSPCNSGSALFNNVYFIIVITLLTASAMFIL
ncbi:hypothetical protein SAMD00019534_066300 [Acytostelium subglobosum LB1]|uniref:hypothetical protein n=1 Tax=Acytostelium subglobosum LB1 TaxID=1410327 RepID=UPI000644AEC1|nr:hypothetical protein SAMD00019534_066300 [Acytostelium subglobosum LB1]GAM23455.1 hypothetical protein SAMD00019534_066300 [Acytostelium subglobosum LB1]|eukprot:XP_012753904.1 hypothetical protein SAMD00019534_066300 [Acytostelium subglobosum LB1]